MDINKENTKYLAYLLSNCGATQDEINDLSFDDEVGFFESNRLADWFVSQINFGWRVWQAAKAHEAEKLKGCVLVPVQCPDPDFADSLFDELSKKAIGEFGDDLLIHFSDIDEEKIWALMVEAAKAQAVPEGFVLVSAEQMSQWGHMASYAEQYGCPECFEARGYAHSLACEINEFFAIEAQEQVG